jgi:hypothetical protein
MKRTIMFSLLMLFCLTLIAGISFAAQGNSEKGMKLANTTIENTPVEQKQQITTQAQERNLTQVRNLIQEKQQKMNQQLEGLDDKQQNMYRNQNQVRLAVHALLAMENFTGDIGPQVSEIARNFNNSVQATLNSEEKIQQRSAFARFFMGGDNEAAENIEQEVNQNQQRIQELKQLREQCNCTEEVKSMFQEQIQNMEQEQSRLQELAQQEKQRKGIFGWMFR